MDGGKECLCSSLAINCFQFGCFLHKRPRCDCNHDNRGWMTKLSSISPEKKLRELVIPGTHDSASVTIPKSAPFSAVGLCQNVSVHRQLIRGARYLDLRIGGDNTSSSVDDVFICHGILKGGPFPDVVDEIHHFLRDNPGEFVILEVIYNPDRGHKEMSAEQLLRTLQLLSSTFDTKITREDCSSWFRLSSVTLGHLKQRTRNILLLVNDKMCGFSHEGIIYDLVAVTKNFSCHQNHLFMKNRWHNTCHARTLLKKNEVFLDEVGNEEDVFVNSQFVMTPQPPGGIGDAFRLLLGMKSLRPVSLARELYRRDILEAFVRDNAENAWNIVLLDFIDLCPQLVRFLLGLNSTKRLQIHRALVESNDGHVTDVTEIAKKLRKRNCCLYVLDFKRDLGVSINEGKFTLKGQLGDDEIIDLVLPFSRDTEYLLCDSDHW